MKNLGMILTQVAIVVAAIALYHVIFHASRERAPEDTTAGLTGGGLTERIEIEGTLENANHLLGASYDEQAMRALVTKAEIDLTPEQMTRVVPLMYEHLAALRVNLMAARDAAAAGVPDAGRVRYRVRAVQRHAAFQKTLQAIVSKAQAAALFRVMPSMIPPVPGAVPPPHKDAPPPPPTLRFDGTGGGK